MTEPSIFLVISVLIGVLALIGAASRIPYLAIRRPRTKIPRTLIVCESIALDPRRRIHLVQCGQRQVMLLTGGGQDVVIGWVQDA